MISAGGVVCFSEKAGVGLELLEAGRDLADRLNVKLISAALGAGAEERARDMIERGADTCLLLEGAAFDSPSGLLHVLVLEEVVRQTDPQIIMIGGSAHGTEVAARLSQRLGVGCATDCTAIDIEAEEIVATRACLGKFVSKVKVTMRPAILTVPLHRFEEPERDPRRTGNLHRLFVDVPRFETRILGSGSRTASAVRIDRAGLVVGVGRGLKKKEDLVLIQALARELGAVVGASRPLTDDLEWLPVDAKIGLSGTTIRPRLYIACGISGQVEHYVGMRDSGVIVAINKDPRAPIMEQADFCVVDDLYRVLPALIRALEERNRSL